MPRYARSPLIASTGRTLVNTLVRPRDPIPPEVTEIHGITNADAAKAPTFRQVMGAHGGRLRKLFGDSQRPIAIYNAVFDLRRANAHCVMHVAVAWRRGVAAGPGFRQPHRALGDAQMTLAVLHQMAVGRPKRV